MDKGFSPAILWAFLRLIMNHELDIFDLIRNMVGVIPNMCRGEGCRKYVSVNYRFWRKCFVAKRPMTPKLVRAKLRLGIEQMFDLCSLNDNGLWILGHHDIYLSRNLGVLFKVFSTRSCCSYDFADKDSWYCCEDCNGSLEQCYKCEDAIHFEQTNRRLMPLPWVVYQFRYDVPDDWITWF